MSSYLNKIINADLLYSNNEPDHIRMNLSFVNNSADGSSQPCQFKVSQTSNILEDPRRYQLCVERFSISTIGLPIWIPLIETDSTINTELDPNQSVYSVSLNYVLSGASQFNYTKVLEYIPQNANLSPPSISAGQIVTGEYYNVYSYQYVVDLLNSTLASAMTGLIASASSHSATLPSTIAPSFLYDPSSSELSLIGDVDGFDLNQTTRIEIYVNNQLFNMLSSFNFVKFNLSSSMMYRLDLKNNNTNTLQVTDSYNAIIAFESYACALTWSPVSRIAFVSPDLQMIGEIMNPCTQFNTASSLSTSSYVPQTLNILTDFSIEASDSVNSIYPSIVYLPYKYRYIDLTGHSPLQTFSIQVYFIDYFGNFQIYPLGFMKTATIKLLFTRK
jgi:hypothetical protein